MKLYCFNKKLKYYTGTEDAALNIAETEASGKNVYFISANSTEIEIPSYGENEIPVFNEDKNEWSIFPNFRGKTIYNKTTKQQKLVDFIGDIPSDYTILRPSSNDDEWNSETNSWYISENTLKTKARMLRDYTLMLSDGKVSRYNSQLSLVKAGILESTTNTENEMILWETYRQQLRDWMSTWSQSSVLPTEPNIA